jgi:transposase
MAQAPYYCGIDVSKETLEVESDLLALAPRIGNDQAGFGQLIKAAQNYSGRVHFVFESTGPYHLGLALALWEANLDLTILNPARVRYFAKSLGKAKTDPLDKQMIGQFARLREPQPTPAPEPVIRELIEFSQRRLSLLESRSAEQVRLEQTRNPLLLKQIKASLKSLSQQIDQLDEWMVQRVKESAPLKAKIDHLCEIKGVGFLTALTLVITVPELGTLRRNHICRLVGLAPLNDDSGKQIHKRFIQGGRKRPRCALYMASLSASRHNEVLAAFYQRLLKAGKPKKVALTAVMRKLLVHLNAHLRSFLAAQSQGLAAPSQLTSPLSGLEKNCSPLAGVRGRQ